MSDTGIDTNIDTRQDTDIIVAYTERESCNPSTGEPGVLRCEYKLVPFDWSNREQQYELTEHFGPRWRETRTATGVITYTRYIRRGVVEPWTPSDLHDTDESALEDIPSNVTAVDPRLVQIRADNAAYYRQKTKEEQREKVAREERRAKSAIRAKSNVAFDKLLNSTSEQYRRLALDWQACMSKYRETHDKDAIETLRTDVTFMQYYNAVMGAVNVPTKKTAIREFLERYGERAVVSVSTLSTPSSAPSTPSWLDKLKAKEVNNG